MPQHDLVVLTAMIQAYAESGDVKNTQKIFFRQILERDDCRLLEMRCPCRPRDRCQMSLVSENQSLCSSWIGRGRQAPNGLIEEAIVSFTQIPERNILTWNAMASTYAHNGLLDSARNSDSAQELDSVSWNVLITAIAQSGDCERDIEISCEMLLRGSDPDSMAMNFHLERLPERLQTLGRVKRLDEAEELARITRKEDAVAWRTLLAACEIHGEENQGTRAACRVLDLLQRIEAALKYLFPPKSRL
ncbi:pentatricopeptide repeat-containing protein At4g20770-like [Selaginella moellendorffii]|uniref:pentatricopeptide repeat-containing protein At4g20770-like n=1 Tax=Selaginella moellendorffii TaxID=88036 RepID=UPI000D1C5929|nr:pentatricopeptide repeat-containing protein At4g20770-like [Selaginella moellendorffii]|eukprot:XP_024541801.1 pentatricopeptide repeat-containing protein At4g20770-like [Selaginella moellendorffii]